jgi:hypothetical protein
MPIKYNNIFHYKPSKIYPNLDFWFETIPSGNPDEKRQKDESKTRRHGKRNSGQGTLLHSQAGHLFF